MNSTQELDQTQENGDYGDYLQFDSISDYSQAEEMNSTEELDLEYSITQDYEDYDDYEDAYYMQYLDYSQVTKILFFHIY